MKLPKGLFLWFMPGIVLFCLSAMSTLYVSLTDSLPYRAFLHLYSEKHDLLLHGDYGTFYSDRYQKQLIKQVKAVPGDVIEIKDGHVWIKHDLGPIQETTLKGEVLTPIVEGTIPEGKAFMAGTHERSIDSRYVEVGLIDMNDIKKVRPIL